MLDTFKQIFNAVRGGTPAPAIPPYVPPPHTPVDRGVKTGADLPPLPSNPAQAARVLEAEAIGRQADGLVFNKPAPVAPAAPSAAKSAPVKEPKWTDQFSSWYRPEVNFHPDRNFLDELCRRTQTVIFNAEEKSRLADLTAETKRIFKELESVGFDAARFLLNDIHLSNDRKIAAGEMPDPVPDLETVKIEFNVKRSHLRGQLRSIQNSTKPIVQGICTRLADAAKKLAEQLQSEEQEQAAKWGHPFAPSSALCALVWLADYGFAHQATCITGPENAIFGLFGHADYDGKH